MKAIDPTNLPLAVALAAALTACAPQPAVAPQGSEGPTVVVDQKALALHAWIRRIVAADYGGDREALDRAYQEADAFLGDRQVESRVRYWKGFAKWRRAINGANEKVTPPDLAADVEIAAGQMRLAGDLDPDLVDARIGEMQCLGLVLFFDRGRAGNDERIARLRALMGELKGKAGDNPRYVWAWGMAYFTLPPEKGGGPENVIPAYLKALDRIRGAPLVAKTPLDPSWGEAELCVNLAYSYLHQSTPDLALAKKYVDEAIRLVPTWHYARDILRPQIEAAGEAR